MLLSIFANLNDKELSQVYSVGKIQKYKDGATIIERGDKTKSFFVVIEGMVDILDTDWEKGKIDCVKQGEVFGELAFIRSTPRIATVKANGMACALEITGGAFESLPLKLQLELYKILAIIAYNRIERMQKLNLATMQQLERLQKFIIHSTTINKQALKSEVIKNVIRKIPKLPRFAIELTAKLAEESISAQQIGNLLKKDPAMAANVLKNINSPFYGFAHKITDLSRALVLLGTNGVHRIIMDDSIKSTMPQTESFLEEQKSSFMVSIIANEVAMIATAGSAGTHATIGLLHGMGKIILLLLKKQNPKISGILDSLDHPKLGALLLESWELPDKLCKTIANQRTPEFAPPDMLPEELFTELSVLYISKICYKVLVGKEEVDSSLAFFDKYSSALLLPAETPQELLKKSILPALLKNENRLPQDIRQLLWRKEF